MGKTFQATEAAEPPVIVFTRTYATEQWEEFLHEQYGQQYKVFDVPSMAADDRRNNHSTRQGILYSDVIPDFTICNVEMLRTYKFRHWYETIIFDEANLLRGRKSIQANNAFELANRIQVSPFGHRGEGPLHKPRVYMLSATPIVKEVDDLYMYLHILDPAHFNSYWNFVDKWCRTIPGYKHNDQIIGAKNPDKLRSLWQEYAIGRTYPEVGLELPHIIPENGPKPIYATMPADLRRMYNQVKDDYRLSSPHNSASSIPLDTAGEMVAALRRLTAHPAKYEVIFDLLDQELQWRPAVIFTHHISTAHEVSDFFKQRIPSLQPTVLDGSIPATERTRLARHSNLVIATIDSLNDAVDLSHLRAVIFAEEDHTYGKMDSAIKRVWRFRPVESPDPVLLFVVMMRNSIDVSTHKTAGRRFGTVRDVLDIELWEKE